MSKKAAKRKEPKADEHGEAAPAVAPPDQWEPTLALRFIDGVLHQKYVPHANLGLAGEHWQPVEEWETDKDGEPSKIEP